MKTMHQMTNVKKVSAALLALALVVLPGTVLAENEGGTGSGVARIASVFRPVTDWLDDVFKSLFGGSESEGRGAGSGTGKPQRGAGNGTGVQQREAASGSGLSQRGAGNGTGRPQRGAGSGTG